MTRFFALLTALVLMLACLPALTETPSPAGPALPGGTTWRSPEGVRYHFTAAAELFFSYVPGNPTYRLVDGCQYAELPATNVAGTFIMKAAPAQVEFTREGDKLTMVRDGAPDVVFTREDQLLSLSGTRWADADGNIFVLSGGARDFSCEATGQLFTRATGDPGVFCEMTIRPDGSAEYDPGRPFALLSDGWHLNLYVSVDGQSILRQTFYPVKD